MVQRRGWQMPRAKDELLPLVKPWLGSLKPVGATGSCNQVLARQSYSCVSKGRWLIRKFFELSLFTSWSQESSLSLCGEL